MNLTNDSYIVLISTKSFTERYFRDQTGWLKISARDRTFRMTAEQVLNHILPAMAGIKPNVTIKVEHHDSSVQKGPIARVAAGSQSKRSRQEAKTQRSRRKREISA